MDQQNAKSASSQSLSTSLQRDPWLLVVALCLLIALPVGFFGYRLGYNSGKQIKVMSPRAEVNTNKKVVTKAIVTPSITPFQFQSYTVSYTTPSGWRTMLWHPTPDSTQNALLSPDYTSTFDPEPQTGVTILIYQYPGTFSTMKQLQTYVEQAVEGLKALTPTTVGGFPAFRAAYVDTAGGRVLDDYDILKDHDHWEVRIILPYNNLSDAKNEEQKYSNQISALLQSIQFKTVQY